ncbi:MAG: phosphatidylserine decarboxylase family protein [Bacteroidota bacterium]
MLTRYGYDVLWKYFIGLLIIGSLTVIFINNDPIKYSILVLLAMVTILVLNFFRDPERRPPVENRIILSPADGKVIVIKEIFEPEYLKETALQVSIFMSPLDVHVNRFPISGIVQYYSYVKGEYLAAFEDKSSERNERTHIGLADGDTRVMFKQVAGAVARRIVAEVQPGQQVKMGERFGMIKFGSRVDVMMPKTSIIMVHLNERVKAGETILAKYPKA